MEVLKTDSKVKIMKERVISIPKLQKEIKDGNEDSVNLALQTADVNEKGPDGWTALHQAVYYDRIDVVRSLLAKGARVDEQKDDGWTALHLALLKKSPEIVEVLLKCGANPNLQRGDGWMPLYQAVYYDHKNLVKLLLDKRARVNEQTDEGWAALHLAVINKSHEIIGVLLKYEANPNLQKKDGWTPLHQATNIGDLILVDDLLKSDADPNIPNENKWTSLHLAASKGYEEITCSLLHGNADVNLQNNLGSSPLHLAIINGHIAVMKLLLGKKADAKAKNNQGQNALHLAAFTGDQEMVKLLKDSVDQNERDQKGQTPLHLATERGHGEVVRLLGGDVSIIHEWATPDARSALFDADTSDKIHDYSNTPSADMWFNDLNGWFSQLMIYATEDGNRKVKIAVLDTGISREHPAIVKHKARLKCIEDFTSPTGDGEDTHFNGHGTLAASLILKVAPKAELYVARVWDEGKQAVDAEAVAKAIRCATDTWKVDIISMSFGFRYWVQDIYEAILAAYKQDILMFAAASNSGPYNSMHPIAFPARLHGHVFCINSANTHGSRTATNPPTTYGVDNFSILGEGVNWNWTADPKKQYRKSGTSIATPIAAGFVAVILQFAYDSQRISAMGLKSFYGMRLVLRATVEIVDNYRVIVPWKLLNPDEPDTIWSDVVRLLRRR